MYDHVCVCVCAAGLSYCRHMHKVRASVAHMVNGEMVALEEGAPARSSLSLEAWSAFTNTGNVSGATVTSGVCIQTPPQMRLWSQLINTVYLRGVEPDARPKVTLSSLHECAVTVTTVQVWPYLLGLYPPDSSAEERAAIDQLSSVDYQRVLGEWSKVERTQRAAEEENNQRLPPHSSRTDMATLSGITNAEDVCVDVHIALQSQSQQQQQRRRRRASETSDSSSPSLSSVSRSSSPHSLPGEPLPPPPPPPPAHSDASSLSSSDDHFAGTAADSSVGHVMSHDPALVRRSPELDAKGRWFVDELVKINKDIPRCDRDYE